MKEVDEIETIGIFSFYSYEIKKWKGYIFEYRGKNWGVYAIPGHGYFQIIHLYSGLSIGQIKRGKYEEPPNEEKCKELVESYFDKIEIAFKRRKKEIKGIKFPLNKNLL